MSGNETLFDDVKPVVRKGLGPGLLKFGYVDTYALVAPPPPPCIVSL